MEVQSIRVFPLLYRISGLFPDRPAIKRVFKTLLATALLIPVTASAQTFVSTPWPEADRLFHQDPRWLGSDAAYSIPLGDERVLWLFGDSWIAPQGKYERRDARMVSNTIGIQTGLDPSRAKIYFFWGENADGQPKHFFSPPDGARLWPSHGIRLGDRLLLFFMRVFATETGLGFEVKEWKALLVLNPDASPAKWRYRWLNPPPVLAQIIIGTGGVLIEQGYVYAFSAQEPVARHQIFLARWKVADARAGELSALEWWTGESKWQPDRKLAGEPTPLFENAQTEFSVHRDSRTNKCLQIQSYGFGAATIGLRTAPSWTGPWRGTETLYVPPEYSRKGIMIYAAKAHPELVGADLILTYATNAPFEEQVRDMSVYFPRFVRLQRR